MVFVLCIDELDISIRVYMEWVNRENDMADERMLALSDRLLEEMESGRYRPRTVVVSLGSQVREVWALNMADSYDAAKFYRLKNRPLSEASFNRPALVL